MTTPHNDDAPDLDDVIEPEGDALPDPIHQGHAGMPEHLDDEALAAATEQERVAAGLTDYAPGTIASQAARLQPALRCFKLVGTNGPGPQFPLYVLGRKMESIFPMVPLARRQALCVGIMSYNGQVNFGLVGDYDGMADLESFGLDLEAATTEAVATAPAKRRKRAVKTGASSNGAGAVASESRS